MFLRRSVDAKGERQVLLAVLGISALCLSLVAIEPLGVDNAVLHSIGKDWALYGRVPYIGSWDNNFPGIMILHALEIYFLGTSAIAFRLFDVAVQLLFVAFFFRFLLRWLRPHTAGLAAVLYTLYYVAGGTYLYGQQDGYGMMAVLVGASLIIDRNVLPFPRMVASALVVGLSFLMRPTFLLYPGLLSIYLILDPNARIVARRIPVGLIYFILCLLPMAGLLSFYASQPNGLDAFYTSTIRFNLDLYTKLSGGSFWIEIVRTGLLLPMAVVGYFALKRHSEVSTISRRDALLELALVAGGLFVVVLMGKFWRYQFAPFFMALIPLSAMGIEVLAGFFEKSLVRHYVTIAALLLCSFVQYNPITPLSFTTALLQHRDPFAAAEIARRGDPGSGAAAEHHVLAYLNSPRNRRASIEICGFDPFLRTDLDRLCVGPYVNFHSIAFRRNASMRDVMEPYTAYQRRWQDEYARLLKEISPDLLVIGRYQPFWYVRDIGRDMIDKIAPLQTFIRSNYRLDTVIGSYEILSRK